MRFLNQQPDAPIPSDAPWCIVANVLIDRSSGEDAKLLHGTKHFAPAAKVYAVQFRWNHDGTRAEVIGRHRKRNQFIRLLMPVKHLTNWRVQRVYQPQVAAAVREKGARTEQELCEIVDRLRKETVPSQPYRER